MGEPADSEFRRRMSNFETQLSVLSPSSVERFSRSWAIFVKDLKAAIDGESLQITTIVTAHALGSRVAQVIQTFLDLEVLATKLMSSLLGEASTVIEPLNPPPTSVTESSDIKTLSPHIKASYDWLVKNIHNPYPSPEIRDDIARKSGAARKDVDHWFGDARKRIGWNEARKIHFFNKRVNIVDAATRFFANDEKLNLSQAAEHALISIMENAKNLYCDKLAATSLATRLNAVVKDSTHMTTAESKSRQQHLKDDRKYYPSPERSPQPTPPPNDDKDDGIVSRSPFITSRKRQGPFSGSIEFDKDDSRPLKRLRLDALSSSDTRVAVFPAGLPSPPSSLDEHLEVIETSDTSSLALSASTVSSRKRRLSESDEQITPKRPRQSSAPAVPLHVGSDPFPESNNLLFDETSFDGWFRQNDIELRQLSGETSPSGISVELGNLSDLNYETPTESRPASPVILGPSESHVIDVADVSNSLDITWNELDFDNLFTSPDQIPHSSSSINFVGQASSPTPLSQEISNIYNNSQGSRSSDDFCTYFGLLNPTIVDPISNETWDFSASVLTKDDTCNFEKRDVDFQGSNELFGSFDFPDGVGFLSPNTNITPPLTQDKIRSEKEKEFREACEKAHRLALELQKDDL